MQNSVSWQIALLGGINVWRVVNGVLKVGECSECRRNVLQPRKYSKSLRETVAKSFNGGLSVWKVFRLVSDLLRR